MKPHHGKVELMHVSMNTSFSVYSDVILYHHSSIDQDKLGLYYENIENITKAYFLMR